MYVFSKLGDPRNGFMLFFPVLFSVNKMLGVHILWLTVISEWLNAVLKYFLFGNRPYWYAGSQNKLQLPTLAQYPLTCETGPGYYIIHIDAFYFYIPGCLQVVLPDMQWLLPHCYFIFYNM